MGENDVFTAYKRIFDFQGRAGRQEYWLFFLVYIVQLVVAMLIDRLVFGTGPGQGVPVLYLLTILANLIPALSVGIRRLHDTNRSGWWMLIGLIPLLGGLVLLVFYVLPGTPGSNRFGPPAGTPDVQETFA
jgi:uncharacterized membrane protein YhaH (DUF805 family)